MLYLQKGTRTGTWSGPTIYVDTNHKLIFSLEATSDASGDASITVRELYGSLSGYCLECNPDGTAVPSSYTIKLNDDQGYNLLGSQGVGLSTTATEFIYLDKTPVAGDVDIVLSNMGDSKKVVIKLFIDRDWDY